MVVIVLCLFLTKPCVGLHYVIMVYVFTVHAHLVYFSHLPFLTMSSIRIASCVSHKLFLLPVPRRCFFADHFCYTCVCFVFVMLSCLFTVALWSPAGKRAIFLRLLCVMFYCGFVTSPCGVLGQVSYLFVSIPDLCLLTYLGVINHRVCDGMVSLPWIPACF